jgi:hypothetical protein
VVSHRPFRRMLVQVQDVWSKVMRLRAPVKMAVIVTTKDRGAERCTGYMNETGSVLMTYHWGAFGQPLLQRTSSKYYIFRVSVCSLSFAACNLLAPFCPAVQYISKLSHKRQDFQKKSYWTQNVCFDFMYRCAWKISHSRKNWARCDPKYLLVFMWSALTLFLSDFNETWISRQIFEKSSDIKLHENLSGSVRTERSGVSEK